MKYFIPERPEAISIDADINDSVKDIAAVSMEDLGSFVSKLVTKIGTYFGFHASMAKYIKDNMKIFDDLNKDAVVTTVLAKDLSSVGNAIQEVNEGLEKLRLGGKLDMVEFCSGALVQIGVEYDRGILSMVKFKSGNWGEGKDKTGLDHPMMYRKTIEEHGWLNGAKDYAERFLKLADTTSKSKIIAASNRHYADVKNAQARGIHRNQAIFDKQVALEQINQINAIRDTLLKFYFSQLKAIMKGAYIQPIGEIPKQQKIPNTYVGK